MKAAIAERNPNKTAFERYRGRGGVALLLTIGALGLSACGGGQESGGSETPVGGAGAAPTADVGAPLDGEIAAPSDEGSTLEERAMEYCEQEQTRASNEGYSIAETYVNYEDPVTGEEISVTC